MLDRLENVKFRGWGHGCQNKLNHEDIRITGNIVLAKKGDWGGCAEEKHSQENWSAIDQVGSGEEDREDSHQGCCKIIREIEELAVYLCLELTLTSVRKKKQKLQES